MKNIIFTVYIEFSQRKPSYLLGILSLAHENHYIYNLENERLPKSEVDQPYTAVEISSKTAGYAVGGTTHFG